MRAFLICASLGFVGGFLGSAREVEASGVYTAAGSCQWNETSSANLAVNTDGSVSNTVTTGLQNLVSCDLATPGYTAVQTTDDVFVYYTDNNSGTGMEDAVICNVRTCNGAQTTCFSETTLYSCTTPTTGCTTPPAAMYTGSGSLLFTDINRPGLYTTNVYCYIPVADTGPASILRSLWYYY